MIFGGIGYSGTHKIAAAFRAAMLSVPATYTPEGGKPKTIYMSPEPIDTMTQQMAVIMGETTFQSHFRVFVVVLEGQEIDFIANPPKKGDKIEIVIGGISETWHVGSAGAGKCWGKVDGNLKIWIFASGKKS